jgi:hypothetical protein
MSEFLGKVYFDNDFAFVDGTSGEKIIIVVGESDNAFFFAKPPRNRSVILVQHPVVVFVITVL